MGSAPGASALRSYPVALGGLYGLLAGGGAGAHAVYVLTVGGVAMMRGRAPPSAQGVATTTTTATVAGVGERARPAGHGRGDGRDHRPERVAFKSRTRGNQSLQSSSGGLGANQRGHRSDSRAFEGGFQRGDSHLGYGHRRVFLLVALWWPVAVIAVSSVGPPHLWQLRGERLSVGLRVRGEGLGGLAG